MDLWNRFANLTTLSNIKQKKLVFIKFDITDYYPSITEGLIKATIVYAKSKVKITELEEDIIIKSKLPLLYSERKGLAEEKQHRSL